MTHEVPWDDLTTNTDGLVLGVCEFSRCLFDDFTVDLVGPTTIVSESGS